MKKLLILPCLLILSACSSTSTKIEKVDISKIKDHALVQKHENTFTFSKYQVANTNYQIQKQNECDTKDVVYSPDHQYSKYFLDQINRSTLVLYQYQNNDCQLIKQVNNVAHYNQAIFFEDKLYFDAASFDDAYLSLMMFDGKNLKTIAKVDSTSPFQIDTVNKKIFSLEEIKNQFYLKEYNLAGKLLKQNKLDSKQNYKTFYVNEGKISLIKEQNDNEIIDYVIDTFETKDNIQDLHKPLTTKTIKDTKFELNIINQVIDNKIIFSGNSSDDQDTSMLCDLDYQTCYQSNILSVLDNKHLLISDQQDHVYLTTTDFSVKEKILNDNDNFISSVSTNKYFELIPVNPQNNNDKKINRYTYK